MDERETAIFILRECRSLRGRSEKNHVHQPQGNRSRKPRMCPAMGSGKTLHHREKPANERKRQTIFSSIYCKPRFQGCPGGIYLIPKTREKYTGRVKRSQNRRDTSFSQWKIPDHGRR